jgi:DNA sulfur modification protein DndD
MFVVKELTLKNFGPYKGTQTVAFPEPPGVIILFGENGRGKTTLLNAIRFALFGKVLGRGSKEIPTSKLINWPALDEGETKASVEIKFKFEGDNYVLTRIIETSKGGRKNDVRIEEFLDKNGSVLNKDQLQRELNKIMPEEVSRFFLFDGELLQEYEDLLIEDDPQGRGIKAQIEKILGVPVIKNAIFHLNEGVKEARKIENKSLQKVKEFEEIAKELDKLEEIIQQLDFEKSETVKTVEDLKREKNSLESFLRNNEKIEKMVVARRKAEESLAERKTELSKKTERVSHFRKTFGVFQLKGRLKRSDRNKKTCV